jgi:ribose transport system permease protein
MKAVFAHLTGQNSRQGLWILPLIAGIVGFAWLAVSTDQFATPQNAKNLLAQAMPLIIVAIGQMMVVLLGGLDLSVGAVISFTTAILALDAPAAITIPAVFIAAIAIGFINGTTVTRLNVNPIIATLAMQMIIMGLTRLMRPVAGGEVPEVVKQLVSGAVFGVPFTVFWGLLVCLLAWKMLYGSRFGLHIFAIGGGIASGQSDAAHTFGIADKRTTLLAYIGCSCFAALAGIFLAGRIVSGDPNIGPPFTLDSVTAVAIGGTQLSGGVGSLHGTIIGALVLALLSNGMNLANVSAFVQTAIKGAVLLAVVAFQSRKKIGL